MFEFELSQLTLAQNDPAPPSSDSTQSTTTTPPGPDGQGNNGETPPDAGIPPIFLILLGFLVLMFIMTSFSSRKEKRKRQELLDALKKNDRVVTIGGIIGTVVEVKPNEITLKVDESSNTRMRFSRTAIQNVVGDDDETE